MTTDKASVDGLFCNGSLGRQSLAIRSSCWRRWLAGTALGLILAGSPHMAMADGLGDIRVGNDAFKNGQFETAIDAYSRAILSGELDIEAMAITFNNRGVVYGELGDYDRAISDYQEALTLRPEDATTMKNLRVAFTRRANAFDNLGEPERSIADYTQALAIDRDHVATLQSRAQALIQTGNLTAARNDLDRAAALEPANQQIRSALAEVQSTLQQQAEAEAAKSAAEEAQLAEANENTETEAQSADATATTDNAPAANTELASVEPAAGDGSETTAEAVIEEAKRENAVVFTDADFANAKLFQANSPVNFRAGPGNDFGRVGAIGKGDLVQVVGIELGWMQVILNNGQQGYIYKKWLDPVEAE